MDMVTLQVVKYLICTKLTHSNPFYSLAIEDNNWAPHEYTQIQIYTHTHVHVLTNTYFMHAHVTTLKSLSNELYTAG